VELSVPGALGPIVQRCTKLNVRRRYPNVAKLREDLYSALSTEQIVFSSREEEEVVKLLESKEQLTPEEWDRVFQQLDENEAQGVTNHIVFRSLTLGHLSDLAEQAPDLFASLGEDYAKYAREGTFNFEYCDVIANRAEVFYERGELDLKASIALALLALGTSHNRWLVERVFLRMAGPDIADELAARIAAEVDVQKVDFGYLIDRLERSISVSRKQLHPILSEKAGDAS
jgi:eukaryotic-like serine/threonine-protein kinase